MKELFTKESIADLENLLQTVHNVAIVTHVNPDGDAIGSSLGWAGFLRQRGINATVIVPNRFPDFLKWMAGSEDIIIYNDNKELAESCLSKIDVLFCLDFNNVHRLENLGDYIDTLSCKRVLIDHHLEPSPDFFLTFSVVPISSTCEIVYRLISALGGEKQINKEMAESIYTGIMTDTGAFSHNASDPELFRIVANLLECGIDKPKIHAEVNNNFSSDRLILLGYTLHQRMKILPDYHAAYIYLTRAELESYNFEPGDTEGFVNLPLGIKGIILSVFFSESPNGTIKISFRSRGDFSVNDMARKHFNGGGHKNAAGGKLELSLKESTLFFEKVLEEYKDELNRNAQIVNS